MRFLITLSAFIALMALAGCNSTDKASSSGSGSGAATRSANTTTAQQQPAQNMPSDGVRRITVYELNEALNKGGVVVVDVRNDAAYKQARIKGAVLIPVSEVGTRFNELPRDKMIVTYCS